MIEIIQEEEFERTGRKELPKDIKQIGKPDIGDRIYVENQTYAFLHPYEDSSEKTAYILLGRFENFAGKQCIFVEAAIKLEEILFEGELPLWNDQTWAYIYRHLKQEYDNMAIVGWAMDIKGQLPNLTTRMEQLHQQNFGGTHQVLFLMDSLEREETFYGSRNGHLYRRDGFYIYYDKTIPTRMNQTMEAIKQEEKLRLEQQRENRPWENCNQREKLHEDDPDEVQLHREKPAYLATEERNSNTGSYRKRLLEKEEKQLQPSYATSFLLLVVVCAFGITAYLNYEKMNAMEATLNQMQTTQHTESQGVAIDTEILQESTTQTVKVESVAGNVQKEESENMENAETPEPSANTQITEPVAESETTSTSETTPASEMPLTSESIPTSESATTSEPTSTSEMTPTMTEAQTYLAQGYYIVQKGDSLMGICKKIYQTTAMMDKLCEVNGIEDENAIYAGQKLILPN